MLRDDRNEYKNRVRCWPEDDCFFRYGAQGVVDVLPPLNTTQWVFIHLCGHNVMAFLHWLPELIRSRDIRHAVIIASPRMMPLAQYLNFNTSICRAVISAETSIPSIISELTPAVTGLLPATIARQSPALTDADFLSLRIHFRATGIPLRAFGPAGSRSNFYRYKGRLATIFGVRKLDRLLMTY